MINFVLNTGRKPHGQKPHGQKPHGQKSHGQNPQETTANLTWVFVAFVSIGAFVFGVLSVRGTFVHGASVCPKGFCTWGFCPHRSCSKIPICFIQVFRTVWMCPRSPMYWKQLHSLRSRVKICYNFFTNFFLRILRFHFLKMYISLYNIHTRW